MKKKEMLTEKQLIEVPKQQLISSIQLSKTSADSPVYIQKMQEVYSDLVHMNQSGNLVGNYKIKTGDFKLSVKGDFTCEQNNPLESALVIVGSLSLECEGNADLRHLRIMVIDPEQVGFARGKVSIITTGDCNLRGSFLAAKTAVKGDNVSISCFSGVTEDFFAPAGFYQKANYALPSATLEQQTPSLLSYFEQPEVQPAICELVEPLDAAAGAHRELPADFS